MKRILSLGQPRNRTIRPIVLGAGIALAAMLGGVHDAYASLYQFQDSLEPNPAADWSFFNSTTSSWGTIENGSTARSPGHDGFMFMGGGTDAWSSFGRQVNISVVFPGAPQRTCAAQVYIAGFSAHGQLEVIDVNTWTYVSIKPFDINNASYQPVTTGAFIPVRPNIFVRVVLIGNNLSQGARVDDLTVQCVS